jgi:uncharacterized small protein (DUF1192 family)
MDDEDRPRPRDSAINLGAASLLAGESLDSYSQDELNARIALLEAEIVRVTAHRDRAAAHRLAADAFFKPKTP